MCGRVRRETGKRGPWLTKEQMREAVAICQSLPGPLAIQVGIYISYLRAGFWGAWAGGWAFILPNFVIVAALGALYVYLGDLKPATAIFYGVSPGVGQAGMAGLGGDLHGNGAGYFPVSALLRASPRR